MKVCRYKLSAKERAAILEIVNKLPKLELDRAFSTAAGIATKHFNSCSKYWLGPETVFLDTPDLNKLGRWLVHKTPASLAIIENLPVTDKNAAALSLLFTSQTGFMVEFHGQGKPVIAVSDKGKITTGRPSSDNNLLFAPHTDLSFHKKVPEIVYYTIISHGASGGESLYCDGEAIVSELSSCVIKALQRPFHFPMPPHQIDGPPLDAPILTWDENRKPLLRYREDGLQTFNYEQDMALLAFKLCVKQNTKTLKLDPGTMVIWDNRRWLHGRNPYKNDGDAQRLAVRSYAELPQLSKMLF